MGGDITVQSSEGYGSTFSFAVPLTHSKMEARATHPEPITRDRFRSLKTLIVDDNAINREILSEQAESWELPFDCAETGNQAADLVACASQASDPYGLILLDQLLPDGNGMEFTKRMIETSGKTKPLIILLTSIDTPLTEQPNHDLVTKCLTKPVNQSDLLDAIMDGLADHLDIEPSVEETGAAATSPAPSNVRARILVAEDNAVNQLVAEEILTRAGHDCTIVENGRQAVEAAQTGNFDLILMDCQMPEMSGFDATGEIRRLEATGQTFARNGQRLPIIALTANAIKGDREQCIEAGMDEYISKPLDIERLTMLIGELARPPVDATTDGEPTVEDTPTAPESKAADPASTECSDIFEPERLAVFAPGDAAFAEKLLNQFIESAHRLTEELQQALAADDPGEAKRAAHTLKGMSANVGAVALQQLALATEHSVLEGALEAATDAVQEIRDAVQACEAQAPNVIAYVEQSSSPDASQGDAG
jgi:CheY-like chemotaxis protein